MAHMHPALLAGTKDPGTCPDRRELVQGEFADVMEAGSTSVSSPRHEAALLALSEAWEHRPPAYSWERAVFEKFVMPAVRAELRAAWREAVEQSGDRARSAETDVGRSDTRPRTSPWESCRFGTVSRPGPRAA